MADEEINANSTSTKESGNGKTYKLYADMTDEERYAEARVVVWWDMKQCPLPEGYDPESIEYRIKSVLTRNNYTGTVSIFAYGDMDKIPSDVQDGLCAYGGIFLRDVDEDDLYKSMFKAMLNWAFDYRIETNFLLISDEECFSCVLGTINKWRYNVLLAHPPQTSSELVATARTVWRWTSFLAGDPPYIRIPVVDEIIGPHNTSITKPEGNKPTKEVQAMNQDLVASPNLDTGL